MQKGCGFNLKLLRLKTCTLRHTKFAENSFHSFFPGKEKHAQIGIKDARKKGFVFLSLSFRAKS